MTSNWRPLVPVVIVGLGLEVYFQKLGPIASVVHIDGLVYRDGSLVSGAVILWSEDMVARISFSTSSVLVLLKDLLHHRIV